MPRGASEIATSDFATDATNTGFSKVDAEALAKDTLTVANQPTAANTVGLDIQANDVGYIATIQMGTPPRDFKLLMDTGSGDLWVGAEGCQSVAGGDCVSSLFRPTFLFITLLNLTVL